MAQRLHRGTRRGFRRVGVVAADGTYKMRTRKSEYTGENISGDDEFPTRLRVDDAPRGGRFSRRCVASPAPARFKDMTLVTSWRGGHEV